MTLYEKGKYFQSAAKKNFIHHNSQIILSSKTLIYILPSGYKFKLFIILFCVRFSFILYTVSKFIFTFLSVCNNIKTIIRQYKLKISLKVCVISICYAVALPKC